MSNREIFVVKFREEKSIFDAGACLLCHTQLSSPRCPVFFPSPGMLPARLEREGSGYMHGVPSRRRRVS
ncbi:hypothetical protein I7I48_05294 [Histoplasma ohiense]|nr:hypothetical protein I7I48_05294 [Histoplasma ohiense (nom. inval.)]